MKVDVGQTTVRVLGRSTTLSKATEALSQSAAHEESFFVCNVGDILSKFDWWNQSLPTVRPFYPVRYNDSPFVLELMASLGCGFDCATKSEIEKVIDIGVDPERILFGNPIKMSSHIKRAARLGVDLLAFDGPTELHKIKAYHPNPKLVLKVGCGGRDGMSLGAPAEQAGELLESARSQGLSVVGLSVVDGEHGPVEAVRLAARVASLARSLGRSLSLVDLGSGFAPETFRKVSEELKIAIYDYLSDFPTIQLVATPGQLLVRDSFSLCASVLGVTLRRAAPVYYIADGVYGSFARLLLGGTLRGPRPLKGSGKMRWESCDVVGPTSDSLDVICESILLPRMSSGDWLLFDSAGEMAHRDRLNVHYVLEEAFLARCKETTWFEYFKSDSDSSASKIADQRRLEFAVE